MSRSDRARTTDRRAPAGKRSAVRRRLAGLRDAVDSRLWPVPLVAVVAGVLLGVALPALDRVIDPVLPPWPAALLFGGGSDAARAVLSAIAGSLISAASLTFSLTVVALQLATNQGSPRLLRLFASDRMVHATLALFLGTFSYALAVLRTVDDATEEAAAFVPRMSLTLSFVLTLASIVTLTFFLAHLARQLRVETMMRDVHREASATIARSGHDLAVSETGVPSRPTDARLVVAPASGFLTGVDRERLMRIAAEDDLIVRELRCVGDNVVAGTPLVEWWPRRLDAAIDPVGTAERLQACFGSAYERTASQDVGFGLRQLVDIALKALSPGVNDPTTAVHALGHISALLCDLADRDEFALAYADADGVARLLPCSDGFGAQVEHGLAEIRRVGADDPVVIERLIDVLHDLTWRCVDDAQRAVVDAELTRTRRVVDAFDDPVELARLRAACERVAGRLAAVRTA